MKDERRDIVRDHSFDGIEEFDNRLPRWWLGTFALTVVIGLYIWTTRYTFATEPTLRQSYEQDMAELKNLQDAHRSLGPTDADVIAWVKDPKELAEGKRVFMANCIVCHQALGQGGIGPNLTDSYWLHGGKPSQIAQTIQNGVPEKGMPTWKGVLSPDTIRHVAAFVVSLKGSNPPGAKGPQGVKEE